MKKEEGEEGILEAKGTTTVALVCKDGVVMATDTRATMGHFIASREAKKVYVIDKLKAMTIAGSVGDAQKIVRIMTAVLKKHRMENDGESMSIHACATMLANWLNNYHKGSYGNYFSVQIIIGGVDSKGTSIYGVDAAGGVMPDSKMISTGSGSLTALGVLESHFKENMTTEEAVDVAIKAIHTATKRDSASGNGINVVKITEKGIFEIPNSYVEKRVNEFVKEMK